MLDFIILVGIGVFPLVLFYVLARIDNMRREETKGLIEEMLYEIDILREEIKDIRHEIDIIVARSDLRDLFDKVNRPH